MSVSSTSTSSPRGTLPSARRAAKPLNHEEKYSFCGRDYGFDIQPARRRGADHRIAANDLPLCARRDPGGHVEAFAGGPDGPERSDPGIEDPRYDLHAAALERRSRAL